MFISVIYLSETFVTQPYSNSYYFAENLRTMNRYKLPLITSAIVVFLLTFVQLKVDLQMLMLDRFIPFGGWIEIGLIAAYTFFLATKMQDPNQSALWRKRSWTLFTIVFFAQLIIGILADERFLLTGKLHLPIPAMIISGPIYRGHLGFMSILFTSTVLLTGPAWCSQLCYFGALDNVLANKKLKQRKPIKHLWETKNTILVIVIAATIILKYAGFSTLHATIAGISFGAAGILIMLVLSHKNGTMMHCTTYCPIGTLVSYTKFISPFRIKIDTKCHMCMACTGKCKYNALTATHLENKKVGLTCTNCGDCLSACNDNYIRYKFLKLKPETARNLYLILTISLHAVFLALGRI